MADRGLRFLRRHPPARILLYMAIYATLAWAAWALLELVELGW